MGFFDKLFGRKQPEPALPRYQAPQANVRSPQQMTDEQALERYRYMLRTAPPEKIEEAHREAFEKLTPDQRQMLLKEMTSSLPSSETSGLRPDQSDPKTLARIATRAEMRNPGYMERTFSNHPQLGHRSGGMGGGMMGGIFGSMVAGFAGSMAAMAVFDALDGGLIDAPMEDIAGVEDMGGDMGGFGDMGGDMGGGWDAEM